MRQIHTALLLVVSLLASMVVGCTAETPTPADITVSGTVKDVSAAAQLIVLAQPVDGISNIVLAAGGGVMSADGGEGTIADVQVGQRIQAKGQAAGGGALLASVVLLMDMPATPTVEAEATPTAEPTATPTPTATFTPSPTPTPTPTPAPEIRIEEPQEGAQITSPVTVRGRVSMVASESTLVVYVYGAGGLLLAEAPVVVDAEVGQPGTFETQIAFAMPPGGSGRVEVLELSTRDGSVMLRSVANVTFPGQAETAVSGVIGQVFVSARVVMLAEADQGVSFIALTDGTTIMTNSGAAATFEELQPGKVIQAFGSPVGTDAMLASRLVVFGEPTPTVPPREIRLDLPQEGATISSPVTVRGWVSVSPFESTLVVRIYDAQQQLLGTTPIMVNAEMGQPGEFDAEVSFMAPVGAAGVLEVVELSAADGSVVVSASANVTFVSGAEFVIAGTVAQVLSGAGIASLAEPVEGFTAIMWTPETRVLAADGSETTAQAIVSGVSLEAWGSSNSTGGLMASVIRLQ